MKRLFKNIFGIFMLPITIIGWVTLTVLICLFLIVFYTFYLIIK